MVFKITAIVFIRSHLFGN